VVAWWPLRRQQPIRQQLEQSLLHRLLQSQVMPLLQLQQVHSQQQPPRPCLCLHHLLRLRFRRLVVSPKAKTSRSLLQPLLLLEVQLQPLQPLP
jgi:hypothetical protein